MTERICVATIRLGRWELVPLGFSGIAEYPEGMAGVADYFEEGKEWYLNGKLHRLDGPALTWGVNKRYYVYGKYIRNEIAFHLLANMLRLKGLE